MNNEITEPSDLFDDEGRLIQDGWATEPIINYNREKVAASWFRLKEWDNYVMNHPEFNVNVTVADVGYMGLISFELVDYKKQKVFSDGLIKFFTKGKLNLPKSSKEGDFEYSCDKFDLTIKKLPEKRLISFKFPTFEGEGLEGDLTLYQDMTKDSIVKVNRYEDPKKFYYSDKILWMPVEGTVKFGENIYTFNTENCYARLDWGRGVWPYKINWYWGGGAGKTPDNHEIWFSHGYSYEDPTLHDKNMVGYDGNGYKLGPIEFHVPENRRDTWKFTSKDHSVDLTLDPIFYHDSKMNYIIFSSKSEIVFGHYNGVITLDNGLEIEVKDVIGHAEKIKWRW